MAAIEALRVAARFADGRTVTVSNVPVSDPLAAAVSELGVAPDHLQYEMALAIAGSASAG